ncbi:uncharacterized protein FTOL_09729 [Fusarium torulosum]|uniref:Uncharacterized protein n=1 Tax=Fusarium torulosum TaxID=33205 RepID=A0AAE8SLU5_9HYPO|nr:uncharacterized protein FTOL_09729 [Fusarium torulosum]
MWYSNERQGDEAISGFDEDVKLLENRKQQQYYNQRRVHPRRSKLSNFSEPSHSKASVSKGEDKELNINEVSTSQLALRQYALRKLGALNKEALDKALGTHKFAARAEVNATAPNDTGTAKPNSQSSNGHMQRQARHGLTRPSTRIAEASHTELKPIIGNKIYSTLNMDDLLDATTYTNDFPRRTESLVWSKAVNDGQSIDNAQQDDSAVTQDERLTEASLNLNPPSHTADHDTFVDQHHDRRDYPKRTRRRPHEQPHPDLIQQTQASSAPTGHSISFHHPGSTHLRRGYQASLSNIRAVQSHGRRGVPVGIRKGKTVEELSNAFSAGGHYTISQDHTAGEETRRSHLLANFGRRCGANLDEQKQLEATNNELNPPTINIECSSTNIRQLNFISPGNMWINPRIVAFPSDFDISWPFTLPDG